MKIPNPMFLAVFCFAVTLVKAGAAILTTKLNMSFSTW